MKANRKFLRQADEAVSPVIAVILMVAITVVLAATVYVWVSGFGSQSSTPASSIALSSANALDSQGHWKNYTVASATPGLKYEDLTFKVDGGTFAFQATAPAFGENDAYAIQTGGTASYAAAATQVVSAGHILHFKDLSSMSGKKLTILDANSNSIILSLTIG